MHESAILEINSEVEVDEYLNGPLQNEVKAKRMRMEVTHARDTSVSKAFPPKHAVFRIFNTTVKPRKLLTPQEFGENLKTYLRDLGKR